MPEINVVGKNFSIERGDLKFFQSFAEEKAGIVPDIVHMTEYDKSMAHLLHRLGKFKSVGEARRNGWEKPIPEGWSRFEIGKNHNKLDLCIWNPA